MLHRMAKLMITVTFIPVGCGSAAAECVTPKTKEWHPYNAYYVNNTDGELMSVVDETIEDLETRTGERFMHSAPVADVRIEIKFSDLEDRILGLATTWRTQCLIEMSNDFKKRGHWTKYDFAGVLRHEVGHCFGMDHSTDENSLMYAYYTPWLHLGEEVINAFVKELTNFREGS